MRQRFMYIFVKAIPGKPSTRHACLSFLSHPRIHVYTNESSPIQSQGKGEVDTYHWQPETRPKIPRTNKLSNVSPPGSSVIQPRNALCHATAVTSETYIPMLPALWFRPAARRPSRGPASHLQDCVCVSSNVFIVRLPGTRQNQHQHSSAAAIKTR